MTYNRLGMESRGNGFNFESVIEISTNKLRIISVLQVHICCTSNNSFIVMLGFIFEDKFFNWRSNRQCLTESSSHLCNKFMSSSSTQATGVVLGPQRMLSSLEQYKLIRIIA